MQNDYTTEEVLAKFHEGPTTGIFTDGGARPNPGPGGWGAVYVVDNEIIHELSGIDEETTNNRMEYAAMIAALKVLSPSDEITIFADSDLVVKTLTIWAHNWRKAGWKKKTGPIKNLELVQESYELFHALPKVDLKWVKAHNGWRWNEYADALASKRFM